MYSKGFGFSSQTVNSGYSLAVGIWALNAFLGIAVTILMIINKVIVECCWSDPACSLQASYGNWEPDLKAVVSAELVCVTRLIEVKLPRITPRYELESFAV